MDKMKLESTAQTLVAPGKGILAMDESNGTCNRIFNNLGIAATVDMRQRYRELLLTAPEIEAGISGAIFYDETLRQARKDGQPFPQVIAARGILPGIKVDTGAHSLAGFPGEKITEGLDGLRDRLAGYAQLGAAFTKWRAVIGIGKDFPTPEGMQANANALARYAALAQEAGLVPIVEPEVLMDGGHTIERCFNVTSDMLHELFRALQAMRVHLKGIILKPNMVVAGQEYSPQPSPDQVAAFSKQCFANRVPPEVAGIAFLSGGQIPGEATQNLHAIKAGYPQAPWPLTFSFNRALTRPALELFAQDPNSEEHFKRAQQALLERVKANSLAARGMLDA